ncbi:N-acetyltransferase family protein [Streptococcus caprae]|uniref:GNAT family N-acetyltransferase n=1 Tax=Streptococcus caprae TaxID=1640501 RepID=A0ABV8CVC0_9STRE
MLRELRDADLEQIRDINEFSLGYPTSLELAQRQFAKLSQDSQHILIGYADEKTDQLLGYVHAQVYENLYSDAGLNVLALAVHPEAQGRGIGKQLMARLENVVREQGYEFIRLNSGAHRLEAHAFYENIGYDGDKTQKRFMKYL